MRSSDGCSARQSMYSAKSDVAVGLRDGAGVGHHALLEPEALVDPVAERLLVLLGDPEQHADGAHRASGRRGRR